VIGSSGDLNPLTFLLFYMRLQKSQPVRLLPSEDRKEAPLYDSSLDQTLEPKDCFICFFQYYSNLPKTPHLTVPDQRRDNSLQLKSLIEATVFQEFVLPEFAGVFETIA
jgi:hypothetical protein